MKRPVYSSEEGYIQFIDRLEEYCNWLEKQVDILNALEAGGVDNWEGYEDAMSALDDE